MNIKTTVKANTEHLISFGTDDLVKGCLKKTENWKHYRFNEFVENIGFEDKFKLNEELAEQLITETFEDDKIRYHEWMLRLLKKEIDLLEIKSGDFLYKALIVDPLIRRYYRDYLAILDDEFREQIQGDWEETDDTLSSCVFFGHRMIADYYRARNAFYFYGGTNKEDAELSFSSNSLWENQTFRTMEEARLAAERYVLMQIEKREAEANKTK